jgi:hypothetical protein
VEIKYDDDEPVEGLDIMVTIVEDGVAVSPCFVVATLVNTQGARLAIAFVALLVV